MSNRKINLPQVRYNVTNLGGGQTAQGVSFPGGLDLTTPSLRLEPGAVRDGLNFECSQAGGYARIVGYERVDGRAAPSAAVYQLVQVARFVNVPAVGQVVTQDVTGATGTIIVVAVATASYIAVTQTTGVFDGIHNLTTPGPVVVGTAVALSIALTPETDAQYTNDAASFYRALIGPVPGSGPILDVVGMIFNGVDNIYAFRADTVGATVQIHKATPAGWVLVPLLRLLNFTGGSAAPLDGDTLTQGTVTATIKRVMWQSGAFAVAPGNSAAGAFVITAPAGGAFVTGAATTSSGGAVVLAGASAPIVIQPGGIYEFVKCNFSGQLATKRIYGCDGVNPPFEFDGETYAPIETGLVPNRPSHITDHRLYLFISQGSSLLFPGAGTPFKWDAIDGGGEIATGDDVTGILTLPGSQSTATLGVYMETNNAFLYGTDPTTFNLVEFNTGLGGLPRSAQNLFDTFVFDTLGVVTLKTTLNWGNFLPTTLTKNLLPFIVQERDKLTCSTIFRQKSSYRVFFSDGYGLWVTTINQQYLGALPVLFPNPVACVDQQITTDKQEVLYFGSSDGQGYVYQMERGTSFDGAPIAAYITMAWDAIKSPRILKRFRAGSIEMQGPGYVAIQFGYQLGYESAMIAQPVPASYASGFTGAPRWDAMQWDNFFWDGTTLAPTEVDMTGRAENVQVTLVSGTAYVTAFNVNSIITHYSMGRGIRV